MRDTFIGVFGGIVLIVSVLCFTLTLALGGGSDSRKGAAQTAVNAAAAQLELETMQVERWLAIQGTDEAAVAALEATSDDSRGNLATTFADKLTERANPAGGLPAGIKPTVVYVFDAQGVVVGRDHTRRDRGQQLGEIYPDVIKTIGAGRTGSALWLGKALNHQFLASYAPIRDAKGKVLGGVAFGRALIDRLNAAKSVTNDTPLFAVVPAGDDMAIFAKTENATADMESGVPSTKQALGTDQTVTLGGLPKGFDGAARALSSYGNGKQAVIAAVVDTRKGGSGFARIAPMLLSILIGLLLVVIGAHVADRYISRPIEDLEEGLLAIMNGQQDIRFELEHKVYGGLVFRLNSLLNELLGVQEDNTDDEGRPSRAPASSHAAFTAPLHLEERLAGQAVEDVEGGLELRNLEPEDYYKQLYDAYLAGQRQVGAPVDVKFAPFSHRIKQIELQLANKHGRPFRLRVELEGRDVVFFAVPME